MSLAYRVARGKPHTGAAVTAAPAGSSVAPDPALPTSERGLGQRPPLPEERPAVHVACWSLCEIQRLREENALLRESAHTFGALAERLFVTLQQERDAFKRPGEGTRR